MVLLRVVEIEEMEKANSVDGRTVDAVLGEAGGENDLYGCRRVVI